VINSPTLTSTKFWPGDMGHFSNHALVFAKLMIGKQSFGVLPFIVQTRDRKTHQLMQGIQGGDIGPKFGYISKENGWMSFNNVSIPRKNMVFNCLLTNFS